MTYLIKQGSPEEVLNELKHYGVLCMKWGVRKDRPSGSRKPSYSIDKEGRISIDKGFKLQRAFKSGKYSDGTSGANYFSFTEKDNNIYTHMMAAGIESRFKIIRNFASDQVTSVVAKEPLKSPSRKEAFDILNSTIKELGKDANIKPFKKDFDSRGALSWYQNVNANLATKKDTPLYQAYFKNLQKSGFNILLDEFDAGLFSELPVVVLDGSKSLKPVSISDIKGDDVKAAKAFLKENGGATIRSLEELRS